MVDAGVAPGQRHFAELLEHGRRLRVHGGDRRRQADDRPVRFLDRHDLGRSLAEKLDTRDDEEGKALAGAVTNL